MMYDASRRRDTLHLDYETKSNVDIRKVGLDVYTLPQNEPGVLMAAYRINDRQIQHWQAHKEPVPRELKEALLDPAVEKWAFNAQFERIVSRRVLKIPTPITNWRCSMVLAYMHSFTGRLEDVGQQVGLPADKQKFKTGKWLIDKFTVPQKTTKNQPHYWRNWITDPEPWEEFCRYNIQDVVTEEAIKRRLINYPVLEDEWGFYELDQLINDRGMPLDLDFVHNIIWMSNQRKQELLDEMQGITGVWNPNSVSQILPWLQVNGYPYDDLAKESVEKALNRSEELWGCSKDDTNEPAVIVLRRRQWASKTSVTKAVAARRTVGPGHRVRFMYQFAGASRTARFAGRGVQPQNLTRTPKMLDPEDGEDRLRIATDLIREGNYDGFDLFINERMLAFSGTMRSMFRAPEGEVLTTCDYSSVETAGAAWVANCGRLLEVIHSGRDPYKDFGTMFYQKEYDEITKFERQICKPPMLGCIYRLSAGELKEGVKTGLLAYAENMGVEMTPEQSKRAVTIFREGYPEIPELWKAYERAIHFVLTTHQPTKVGPIGFEWMKPYLLIKLPSGRYIYYYKPQLKKVEIPTGRMKRVKMPNGYWGEKQETFTRTVFSYMGRNQKTTQWDRVNAHGGVTTENVVQALTRDILKVGMQRLHKAGFNLIGHSHDEAIALTKQGDNYFTLELMRELMKAPIEWAPGFPLNAAGWVGPFYRK